MNEAEYQAAVKGVKTIADAMELLGECSDCSITCCFDGGILYIEPHAPDLQGNGLTIAIAASVPAMATITDAPSE